MTELLTHDSIEQLLPAAALEIVEGDELVRVMAHVRHCAECARQLESYRQVLLSLANTLPLRPLDPARSGRLKARLLARAASSRSVSPDRLPSGHRRFHGVVDRWTGWAVAAGLAGLLLVHHSVHRPVAYGWLAAGILTIVLLGLAVYIRRLHTRLSALDREDEQRAGGERSPPFP